MRSIGLVLFAVLITLVAPGCDGDKGATPSTANPPPTFLSPPPPTPPPLIPQPQPQPQPQPPPQPPPPPNVDSRYPLTQAQAYALAQAGVAVAGLTRNGLEVLVMQTTETTYEDQPVQKEVCDQEYDYYEERYKTKCTYKTVYESRPVTKTIYIIGGTGAARAKYTNLAGPFAYAVGVGCVRWRRA